MKISKEILSINNDRKKELINRVHEINKQINNFYKMYEGGRFQLSTEDKIQKAFYLYQKNYKCDTLSDCEKSFFALYLIFEDDEKYLKMLRSCKYNHEKVSLLYNLTEICSSLRYKNLMMMRKYENNIEIDIDDEIDKAFTKKN